MVQVDWQTISVIVIGFFALNGFFRGWWKEAIMTVALLMFLFLVQNPDYAQWIIERFNEVVTFVWELITGIINEDFGISPTDLQLDPGSAAAWLVILLLVLGAAALLARWWLPNTSKKAPGKFYVVQPIGRILGLLLGLLNGFLFLSLVREYLDGRTMAVQTLAESEITLVGRSAFGPPSAEVGIQVVDMPSFTVLDSIIPWILIGGGVLLLIAVFRSRVKFLRSKEGQKMELREPYGYRALQLERPKPPQSGPRQPQ